MVKNPPSNSEDIRDLGSIHGSRRSPRGGYGTPLQYSFFENPMDRGSWQANSQWGHKESHTAEQLTLSISYICMCVCVCVCVRAYACVLTCFHHVQLFASLWIVACQTSPFMVFSRQEYWSGLPCPPPGDLPTPVIKSTSSALQADSVQLRLWGSLTKYIFI